MVPGEEELAVADAREDKARRGRIALMLGVAVVLASFLVRQPLLGGLPGYAWSTSLMVGALVLAWQSGVIGRAHAMLRLGAIRRGGLAATAKLNAGDVAGAREGFAALLHTARPLGAFHAVHVLMYGVTRYFEGETKEGLKLVSRALGSGWLDLRHTVSVKESAETWRILMLLDLGDLAEARRRVDATRKGTLALAALAVSAHEGKWDEVLQDAERTLADAQFQKAGKPAVALLGLYAAKQLGRERSPFQKYLAESPPGPLQLKNPALRKFF
ncbi:MAG: hypothetical protein Q8L48_11310 [Archangium sp.]|nr:hypothetical protein [Archangium sp.]